MWNFFRKRFVYRARLGDGCKCRQGQFVSLPPCSLTHQSTTFQTSLLGQGPKRPQWRRRIFNSFFFSRFYTIFYNSWSGECPLAPGKSGHQEENRRGAKGGEDTSKVLLLLLRPPLLKRPSSTPPTQTTLYDIESAFGTYIIPSLESKLRCQCHKFLILTS